MTGYGGKIQRLDLVGQRYGKLVVVEPAGLNRHSQSLWRCRCDCGVEKVVCVSSLRRLHPVQSCGCLKRDAWKSRPDRNVVDGTFRCTRCGGRLPLREMAKPKTYRCTPCNRDYHKGLYARDPERHREHRRRYLKTNAKRIHEHQKQLRVNHPEKTLLRNARDRATKRGLPFALTLDNIQIPETCPVLGVPLVRNTCEGPGFPAPNSPTLDRLDPAKGYVPGNVAVISWRANSLKKDGTLAEFERLVQWMRSQSNDNPQ